MDNHPLTNDGDRSGVAKPSTEEKARNCLRSAIERLGFMETHWPPVFEKELQQETDAVVQTLQRACRLYAESLKEG